MEENKTTQPAEDGFRFSEFSNVRSKCARNITLQQFMSNLRSDRFRQPVEEYRRLQQEAELPNLLPADAGQSLARAKRIKDNMMCGTPSAVCFGGHGAGDFRGYSGIVCIDLDHTDGRTAEIKELLAQLPYVLAVFLSISGRGVKVFVRVQEEMMAGGYAPLYAAIGEAISHRAGHPYDTQCKALTHPCYYSWDPDAYYNPGAEVFPYVKPQAPAATAAKAATATTATAAGTAALPVEEEAAPAGFLEHFVSLFEQEYPFRPGQRNAIALKLGRAAARKGFSRDELERLVTCYAARNGMPDFNEKDIRQRVLAGYQYVEEKQAVEEKAARVHFGSKVHYGPPALQAEAMDEADLSEKNDEMRGEMPCIPDEVYETLPPLLRRCVEHPANLRERDIMLLGSLACCSALFPHVSLFYRDRYYSPHFYLALVAPAGSGKGVMSLVSALLDRTDEHYRRQNSNRRKEYDEAQLAWETETQRAKREKRKADINLKPEAPVMQYFKLAVTTSKSRLIESLAASGNLGCIMLSTEIMTLSTAFAQDYGNFEDILLKCYQHEEVSSSFKSDGEPKVARNPRLALCLSGTQEQFMGLFRSLESGLYSRFAFYTRPQELVWDSCAPGGGNVDKLEHYRTLGAELFEMHKKLLESPTTVCFTPSQWQEHADTFGSLLLHHAAQGNEAMPGIVMRCGLLAMRLAALFTVFRKCSDYPEVKEYTCTPADFHAAMLTARTLLQHSALLSTSLPATLQKPALMQRPNLLQQLLDMLPVKFSYTEFMDAVERQGTPPTTGKRWLKKCVALKLLLKEENSYRKP